jgi:imidazole glycerol-phosphate synthase subunit HisH
MKVAIVDYGAGNLGSVVRALAAIGVDGKVVTTATEARARAFDKLVFPGVGAAGQAMAQVRIRGLDDVLREHVSRGRPLLGICVGMQILGEHSDEDDTPCLGLLPFRISKLNVAAPMPHMGWNSLAWSARPEIIPLRRALTDDANVYYVHSYCAELTSINPNTAPYVAASTSYGEASFAGVVALGNVWGTQFHVEKSGKTGLQILKNFVELS